MSNCTVSRFLAYLFTGFLVAPVNAEQDKITPDRFAIIFNMGYAGDRLPKDPQDFERLVVAVKSAHFNTILCRYTPERGAICKKHGLKIFVDLLTPDHHVYKNVDGARKLCESLRGNDVVYAYHVWSDNIGNTYPGRSRDVKNVQSWDPTHPVYVGTARMSRVNRVVGMQMLGYYDFHWKRGGHWGNVSKAMRVATSKKAFFLRYCDAAPGRVGVGNVNRCGYTIATSIPFGLKGYLFHYAGGVVDAKTGKLDTLGKDLQAVNARFATIGDQLMQVGNPTAVYSTPITKTAKDRPAGDKPMVPGGLVAVPMESPYEITSGEVLIGQFKGKGSSLVLAFASHNAYQPQAVEIRFKQPPKSVEMYDRSTGKYRELKVEKTTAAFHVPAYTVELVRVTQ